MLSKAGTLKGYRLHGLDGEIGKVKEFYFDDEHWMIRYLVADTGNWLTGSQVLISPYGLVAVKKGERSIDVSLTKKQIEDSPSLASDMPVSRQFEGEYFGYYGWPVYWGGPHVWGAYPFIVRDAEKRTEPTHGHRASDPHLRSTHEVSTYHIHCAEGEIGHVEDFIIDDDGWAIRYLIVDTRNWWQGKRVLISPRWIDRVRWGESKVFLNLSREAIEQSPEYTEESLPTRDYETGLHQHYDRQGYWIDEEAARAALPVK